MNRKVITILAFISILLINTNCWGDYPEANLEYLGYTDEIKDAIDEEIGLSNIQKEEENDSEIDEVNSTVEQLKELAVSRSITENMKDRSLIVKEKNTEFWAKINKKEDIQPKGIIVSEETKDLIKSNVTKALENNGYKLIQFDIIPWSEFSTKNAVKAVIRVVKTPNKGGYQEIQNRLNEVKEISMKAAIINNHCMLSEMTTFIVENPKNNYYYEKTILR
jgi:hypothetical protein